MKQRLPSSGAVIDFVKFELPNGIGPAWAEHPALDFFTPTNYQTGEVGACSEAVYQGLKFQTYPSGRAVISGSLHKFWHGQHNGGEFPAWAVQETITQLAHSFGFQPEQARLRKVEFGLNVPLPASATDLLQRAVLYKTLPFDVHHHEQRGYYIEATAQQYYVKFYDKDRQLVAQSNPSLGALLRVEVKTRRMAWLRGTGVATLADLANTACLARLGERLAKVWETVLFAAVTVPPHLSATEQGLLVNGSYSHYWQTLNKEHPASLRKNRQRYRELTTQYAPDTLALAAAAGLATGWERLLTAASPIPELTGLLPRLVPAALPVFDRLAIGVEAGAAEATATMRRCQTCGRNISEQRANSRFCSQTLYGATAKRCRNADSNPRNNMRRSLRRLPRYALPDVLPYLQIPDSIREFVLAGVNLPTKPAE